MAKRNLVVPDYNAIESAGNRARSIGGGGPGSAGFNNTTATDIGAGFGVLAEASQRISFERDSVASVKAETEGLIKQDAAIAALDPLAPDYNDRVKAIVEDNKRETLEKSGITNAAVKDQLSQRMDRSGAAAQITSQRIRKDAVSKETERVAMESVDMVASKIRNDPGNANAYLSEFQGNMERLKVGMDPTRVPLFAATASDTFAKNQVIGYAEKGNIGAARAALKEQAQYLKGETVTGLSSYIDGRETKMRIDGDRAQAASANLLTARMYDWAHGLGPAVSREEIDAKFKGTPQYASMVSVFGAATEKLKGQGVVAEDRAMAAKATDISARISDAQAGKGPMPSREEIDALKTFRQYDELVKQHNAVEIQQRKVQLETQGAIEAYNLGTMDGTEKQAGLAFAGIFGNVPFGKIAAGGSPDEKKLAITTAVTMSSQSGGILPPQMKDLINNSDNITDPAKSATVAFAAEAADEIEARAPGKLQGVTLSDTGVVNRVRAEAKRLMQDGVTRSEAYVQAAQTQMPKDKLTAQKEVDFRVGAKDELKKMNATDLARDAVTTFSQRNIPFVTTPAVGAEMGEVYKRTFEDAYVATGGDKERAKALAAKKIADTYGETKIGVLDAKTYEANPATGDQFGIAPSYTGTSGEGMSGQGRVTIQAHPPEKYMRQYFPNLSPDQLSKMAMADLDAINKRLGITPAPSADTSGAPIVQLVPDARTADEVRKGQPPSYQYRVLRGDLYEPIATANGPLRWRVPSSLDQVKDNPVYKQAEQDRLTRDRKAQELDIRLRQAAPDPVADERLQRMREEGRKAKGEGKTLNEAPNSSFKMGELPDLRAGSRRPRPAEEGARLIGERDRQLENVRLLDENSKRSR